MYAQDSSSLKSVLVDNSNYLLSICHVDGWVDDDILYLSSLLNNLME